MTLDRRQFLASSAAAAFAVSRSLSEDEFRRPLPPGEPAADYAPVVTPDGAALPFKIVEGVKVFHLVAEPVVHEFAPGLTGRCFGYNGRVHGPTIEAVEGDRVRIYVTNRLPEPTTVHWHGISVPNGMDGVAGLTQRPIRPGETFRYEFELRQHGTFMYHPHHDEMVQMAMGLMGMFVVHPRKSGGPRPDRDYVYLLTEWKITPGTHRPDPFEMNDFNLFTFNGRAFPGTAPIVAKLGDRVRLRLGNLSATDHHPLHLHGTGFWTVETDGGTIPESARWPETTVLVPVGSTRAVEFQASNPGDWILHCHMTHHMMNQMGHGIPNLVGTDASIVDEKLARVIPEYGEMARTPMPGEEPGAGIPPNSIPMSGGRGPFGGIDMGGMVTILKVRETLPADGQPPPYSHPPGTVADLASQEDMKRDGLLE